LEKEEDEASYSNPKLNAEKKEEEEDDEALCVSIELLEPSRK
jgi:hypothetical protein